MEFGLKRLAGGHLAPESSRLGEMKRFPFLMICLVCLLLSSWGCKEITNAISDHFSPEEDDFGFYISLLFIMQAEAAKPPPPSDLLTLVSPSYSSFFNQGDTALFSWSYSGLYLGSDPSKAQDPNACARGGYRTVLQQEGGTFGGYRLEISKTEFYYSSFMPLNDLVKIVDAPASSTTVSLNLAPGTYYWRALLAFNNAVGCPRARVYVLLPQGIGSFTIRTN